MVSHLVIQSRHTTVPQPSSTGRSNILVHSVHKTVVFWCVQGSGVGKGCVEKKEAGANPVSLDTKSFGVLALVQLTT